VAAILFSDCTQKSKLWQLAQQITNFY